MEKRYRQIWETEIRKLEECDRVLTDRQTKRHRQKTYQDREARADRWRRKTVRQTDIGWKKKD